MIQTLMSSANIGLNDWTGCRHAPRVKPPCAYRHAAAFHPPIVLGLRPYQPCLVSLGTISFVFARQLAEGAALARGICIFLTLFWTLRLVAATLVFDVSPYLCSAKLRMGYQAANIVFVFLPLIYLLTA